MTRMPESAGKDYQLRVVIKDVEILRALAAAGIATTVQLLEKCRSSDKVSRLASTLGIPTETLARFVSACDLMRIRGIGPIQATELAEFTDIQGLLTLREASPQDVVNQLKANERRRPSASTIEGWKNKAAALPLLAETEMGDNWQRTSVLRSARFSFRFIAYLWIMLLGLGFAAYFVTRFRIVAAVQAGILDIEQLVAMKRFLLILYDESLLAFVSMATGIGFLLLLPLPVLQRSLLLFVDGWTRLRERAEYFQLLRFLDARGSAWDNKVMPWAIGVGTIIGVITLLLSLGQVPDITPFLDSLSHGEGSPLTIPVALIVLGIPLAGLGVLPTLRGLRSYPGNLGPSVVRHYMRRAVMKDLSTLFVVLIGMVIALEGGQRVSRYVAEHRYYPRVQAAAERLEWTVDLLHSDDPNFTFRDRQRMANGLRKEVAKWDSFLDDGWRALSSAIRITGACLIVAAAFLIVAEQLAIMLRFRLRKRRAIYLAIFMICAVVIPILGESYLRRLLPYADIGWVVTVGALALGLVSGMLVSETDD